MKHKKWYIIQGKTKIEKMLISFVKAVLHSTNVNNPPKAQSANIDKIIKLIGISDFSYTLDPILRKRDFLTFFVNTLLDNNPINGSTIYVYPSSVRNAVLLIGKINAVRYVNNIIKNAEQTILILLKVQNISSAELWIFSTVLLLLAIELKYASASNLLASILSLFTLLTAFILFYQFSNKYTQNNIIKRSNNK